MSKVHCITRFVAYFPNAGDRGRDELAAAAEVLGRRDVHIVRHEPWLLAVTAPAAPVPLAPTDSLLDVFPGTAASARLAAADFTGAQALDDLHRQAETSAQCYNLIQADAAGFRLESDALGLKPVYSARTPGGNVMGSRIADLLHLFPALAEATDAAALYEMLGFWAPLMGRTLHRRIRRTLPGGCYRWTQADGLSGQRGRDLRPTPVDPMWFMDKAIKTIRDTAGQSLVEKTAGASRPILLGLSGGYDSRFIAALCRDHHIDVRAQSHGRRQTNETASAAAIARALGLELQTVPYRRDVTLRYLPEYLDATEGTADPAAASMMNIHQVPSSPGTTLLHGFCGDVPAGNRIGNFSAADYASRESMAEAVTRHYYPADRPDLFGLFSPAPHPDDVHQDVLDGLRSDCAPHQAYVLWHLENRSRRYVATQCALLGEHFDVVMPFYDRRLLALWHSIPPLALADRAVLKRLMARYYPRLARIPHPEELAPITPNLRWQLARFSQRLPGRLLAAGIGHERAQRLLLRTYRHGDIYMLSKLAAPQQRRRMLGELSALRPALKQGLAVELSPHYEKALAGDLQALRVMFMVAHYAQRLRVPG